MKTQIFSQYYTNTYWPLQKHIMQRLFWVSRWFMKEVIRYCLLLETGWLVPHCASTEAATARLHGFLFWTLERQGIKCRSNIWKRFLPGVQEFLFNQKINPSPLLPDLFNSIRRYCYSVEIMFTISILLKVNIMNDNSNISLMSKNFPFLDILDFHKKLSSCNMQITNSNWVVH